MANKIKTKAYEIQTELPDYSKNKNNSKTHEHMVGGAGQAIMDGNKTTELWTSKWPENLPYTRPILPAVCEKNVFHFICSSVNRKPHFHSFNMLSYSMHS